MDSHRDAISVHVYDEFLIAIGWVISSLLYRTGPTWFANEVEPVNGTGWNIIRWTWWWFARRANTHTCTDRRTIEGTTRGW